MMAVSVSLISSNRVFSRSRSAVAWLFEGASRPSGDTSPSSCRSRQQLGQPNQIEGRAREDEEPIDLGQPAQLDLANPGNGLQPPEGRFDARSRVLTDRIALVTGGAAVNRTAAWPRQVLRDVWGGVQLPHQVDKVECVIRLVGAQGAPAPRGA